MKIFMGTSQPYSLLGGWIEILGGLLLCFRRTTLLGALVILGLMSNVFALNLFYGFGMKRFSLELTLFSLIIILPHLRQLIQWILFNKPIQARPLYGPWTHPTWRWVGTGMMSLWMVVMLSNHASLFHQFALNYVDAGSRGDLDGTWEVVKMKRDGVDLPALIGSNQRWRSLTIEQRPIWTQATAYFLDGQRIRWRFIVQDDQLELRSMTFDDDLSKTDLKGILSLKRPSQGHLFIEGKVEGSQIKVELRHRPQHSFKLLQRHVHFVE